MKPTSLSSAAALLKSLSVADLETRLDELSAEEKATRTILRSLKARDRERAKASRKNRPIIGDAVPTESPSGSEVPRG